MTTPNIIIQSVLGVMFEDGKSTAVPRSTSLFLQRSLEGLKSSKDCQKAMYDSLDLLPLASDWTTSESDRTSGESSLAAARRGNSSPPRVVSGRQARVLGGSNLATAITSAPVLKTKIVKNMGLQWALGGASAENPTPEGPPTGKSTGTQ